MEKTIVIYKSKYGTTKKYAEWLAEELECPAVSIDDFKRSELKNYDKVIYGGAVQAGGIKELDKFMKWIRSDLKLLELYRGGKITEEDLKRAGVVRRRYGIFAVGINLENEEARRQLLDINFPKSYMKGLPCFYLPGEYHPENIRGADKLIIGMAKKMISKKKASDATEEDRLLLERLEKGCNMVDRGRIAPIVREMRK